MAHLDDDEQDDKPLDPAMENVRRKMVKLQLVSGGIMLLMFMAVLAAIVYKVTRPDGTEKPVASSGLAIPADQPLNLNASLPAGFSVTSTDLSSNQILFYGTTADGVKKALVFDLSVGRIIADVTVSAN
ncbi:MULTISPECIES: hypothetical protein [Alphaproteobacteria]|uniref:Transmembrane protein n=2 Tax=Alphaproteobacteria TaxID=28211 RepID=A0A512HJP9_9HYPH|nr:MULTISPECIES: hypothetical protein [Alphaproteobacteria]GEO85630.1 hypothetical protein RNA01_25620 [Ciceribacter naphthalenivorans]GLR22015.1 hypothetical protein GCM10007920_18020 [Ciceribacter naphthalenivorans]GLT04871.1 hypothetical protein GCM10007926_18020 [Sphingomonas psychrolutea]